MNDFTYCSPTRYIFGHDAERQCAPQLQSLGAKHVMIVTGGGSARRSGLLGRLTDSITAAGIKVTLLEGVNPNPTDDRVYEGIDICRREGVDFMLGVGGGSAIDTAKAIAAGVPYDGDFWDFYAGKAVVEKALPIGVVLTIPAAGSEGSGNSVITRLDGNHKISLRTDTALRPLFAILDPALTFTLPKRQMAAGIADMMAHVMERYFSPTPDVDITDRISEGVLRAIIDVAPKAILTDPCDYQARANIMWAGTMAHNGICGCGRVEDWVSHFMEHEISAVYGVTHGEGLAVVFPAWLSFMAEKAPAKPAQFARRVFDVRERDDRAAAYEGIDALRAFYASLGLPTDFAGLGISDPDIPLLVKKLHENKGDVIGGYFRLTQADTYEIYKMMVAGTL